jgi:hypothetical protein
VRRATDARAIVRVLFAVAARFSYPFIVRSTKTLTRVCAVALLSAAHVQAQELALSEDAAAEKSEHPPGSYAGVKPGGDQAPAVEAKPGSSPAITWPGFQMLPDGGSRVFVQVTTQVDVSAALVKDKVIVDFGNVAVPGQTNRFPLITKYFNTPVTSAEVKRANKRTTLELSMRAPVEPRLSHDQAKSGFHFVYIDFPPGAFLQTQESPAAAPAAPADLPEAAKPESAATREAPSYVGETSASGSASARGKAGVSASGRASFGASASGSASMDNERPPGMGETKASGTAKAGGKLKFVGK